MTTTKYCIHTYFSLAPDTNGKNGAVQKSFIQYGTLDAANKKSFPVELIRIMRRQAEDLLLSNSSDQQGRDILTFIVSLTEGRSNLEYIKKGRSFSFKPPLAVQKTVITCFFIMNKNVLTASFLKALNYSFKSELNVE